MTKLIILPILLAACTLPSLSARTHFGPPIASSDPTPSAAPSQAPAPPPPAAKPAAAPAKRITKYDLKVQYGRPPHDPHWGEAPTDDVDLQNRKKREAREAEEKRETEARYAAYEAELTAAKLTDDKLELARGPDDIYGPGKVVLKPAQLKKMKVAFYLKRDSQSGEWTLVRDAFSGDHIARETTEGFLVEPGPSKFR